MLPLANKCTQLTIHGTSSRHVVQSVQFGFRVSLHKSHKHSPSLVSVLLVHSAHLSTPLKVLGANLG